MRKFIGEYVSGVHSNGEDVIHTRTGPHTSLEAALADAIERGRAANVMEWVSASEYVWVGTKRDGYWHLVQRHAGDYEFQEAVL